MENALLLWKWGGVWAQERGVWEGKAPPRLKIIINNDNKKLKKKN